MEASPREPVQYAAVLGPYWLDTPEPALAPSAPPTPPRPKTGARAAMVVLATATVAAALLAAVLG